MDRKLRQLERSGDEAGVLAHRIRMRDVKRSRVVMAAWLGHKPSREVTGSTGDFFFFAKHADNQTKIYAAADLLDQSMPDWEFSNIADYQWMQLAKPAVQDDRQKQCWVIHFPDQTNIDVRYGELRNLVTENASVMHLRERCLKARQYLALPRVWSMLHDILECKKVRLHGSWELIHPGVITLRDCIHQSKEMKAEYLTRLMMDSTIGPLAPLAIYKINLDRTIQWLLGGVE